MSKAVNPNCQVITSVGIDIGTTTTQLVISRLTIKNTAPGTSAPRMEITEKEVLYRSQIYFTPLLDDHHIIDAEEVKRIVLQEFHTAGLTPDEIDTGAFPMVYLINKYLSKPLAKVGNKLGLTAVGSAGILAGAANILALFRLIKDMPARDKVICIAFGVCAAFTFGDHLAFTANFQPTMILPIMLGKLTGGFAAIILALKLSVPRAQQLELEEQRESNTTTQGDAVISA